MIILHAGIYDDKLLIWGEQSAPGKAARTSQKRDAALLHPFACPHKELVRLLTEHSVIVDRDKELAACKTIGTAPLPAVNHIPVHSTADNKASEAKLETFTIPVLALVPKLSLIALFVFADKRLLAPGVVLGPEIAVAVELMRLATRVVISQQYLPAAKYTNNGYIAKWKPVLSTGDLSYLSGTAQKMPAILQAFHIIADGRSTLTLKSGLVVIEEYVADLVDYLVRVALVTKDTLTTKAVRAKRKHSSIHDAWLNALASMSSKHIEYERDECEKLCQQLVEWQRPVVSLKSSPFRLCFRLDEPCAKRTRVITNVSAESDWQISYHLQSRHDPSLIVPVNEVWRGSKSTSAILNNGGFNAKEYLLLSLGQAAKLYPQVGSSLRTNAPSHHVLDSQSAFDFLKDKSLLLEEAGFGVMLPAWWSSGNIKTQLKMKAKVKSPKLKGKSGLGLDSIVEFNFEAALGDQKLTFEELSAIAKLKAPLVSIRGQWVHIDPEQLALALKYWPKKSDTASLKDLIDVAIGAKNELSKLAVDEVVADGWIAELLKQLEEPSAVEHLAPPGKLQATLRPYQLRGYSWLSFLKMWGLGACLADDMGLGKTIQTLAMIQKERETEQLRKPVLLVCPTSVVNNWVKEGQRFTPSLKLMVHHGAGRAKDHKFKRQAEKSDIVISSYSLLHRDLEHLKDVDWDGVILDEAQNIKNAETKQAQAAKTLKPNYRVALTGTPVENNVGDLWSIMDFLNPGLLGNQNAFRKNFFYPIQMAGDIEAQKRLKRVTQPFILRRLKTDKSIICDLPDKQESKVYCQLTKEQASLYAAVLKDMEEKLEQAEGMQRKGLVLATLSKLKQVCNHPAQFLGDNSPVPGRSGKLNRLAEIMEEILEAKDKVLIFSQFTVMSELLKPYLEDQFGYPVLFLHGGVVKKKRDEMVERFQSEAGLPIFLLSIKAGGTGLNLTEANHVIHFDRWWNPAVENQATDRAFRIGQKKNVQVHKFVCTGTLEEKIDDMIEQKQTLASNVVSAGEAWLTELSNKELKQVFALSKEAVAQ